MKIAGTGRAMPSLSVNNDMLSVILDTNDEWISTRTGIRERRILSKERLEDLAVSAARAALVSANVAASDIDYMICSNVINNFVTPSLSCIVQGEIEARCPCLDINAACSGFIYALDLADALLKTGRAHKILVLCAEQPSRMVNWKDRSTCVLFGDGAGAVVLTDESEDFKAFKISTVSKTDPLYYQRAMEYNPFVMLPDSDAPMIMNGKEVFKLAVSSCLSDIKQALSLAGKTVADINYYLLHQANLRIIQSIRELLEISEDKFPHNIERYGNISSASIPVLLDELHEAGTFKKGDTILMSAFGAGFTSGACIVEWSI
ncbi:MAG: ketoacyl-ACP synthase III [Bacteroidales bacterium]|jgi:3-oxoacyl-[acyl-carrier-protein] synthase-3|nr:ketoacyl-ACP synthase III [Bacteroidales bacterium]